MEVQLDRIRVRELIVHAVKDVFFVAVVVQRLNSGGSRKRLVLKSAYGKEVAPFRASPCGVQSRVVVPKLPYEAVTSPCGVVWPRPERVVTLATRLVLSPYSAGGAPSMTSSDWTAAEGAGWRRPYSADR